MDWKAAHDDQVRRKRVAQAEVKRLRVALREIATRPKVERNPDGDDQAAWTMALIAEDALKEAHGSC